MNRNSRGIGIYFLTIAIVLLLLYAFRGGWSDTQTITQQEYSEEVTGDKIARADIYQNSQVPTGRVELTLTDGSRQQLNVSDVNTAQTELNDAGVTTYLHDVEQTSIFMTSILPTLIMAVVVIFLFMMMNRQAGGGNNKMMNFGKSRATMIMPDARRKTFKDVAGLQEEKEDLEELVDFLKEPQKYTKMGARIPKGVILVGPPGTGKTLLAKAVAGEAGVPFFSISGSDFVEMFVGVGASRVRDLFEDAKKNAPCIVFIDEIDAVARRRGTGMGGGHDEREQTLNQLLVEMDGFGVNEGIIVMAATNRVDILDPAILRPGRFDRKILVGAPDVKGREAILRVHARNKPLGPDVDLKEIAKQTPGFVGADLANLLNEAALLAARRNENEISAADVDEAEDRVIAGPAKRDRVVSPKERETVAYHEAGHTIVGLVLNDARVVHKVTIVPRGRAGGYAIMLPREDQMLMSKKNAEEQIAGLMGGRAAEEIIFHSQSSGASNDFEQATQIARAMVTQYGMSDKIGPVELQSSGQVFAGQGYDQAGYSEHTAALVDEEIKRILNEGHEQALHIIETHREQHKLIAEALLKYETLNEKQILSLYKTGKMPEADVEAAEDEQHAATFEESKRALERRETEKVEDEHDNDAESDHASQTPDSSASNDQNDHHDDHDDQA